MCRHTHGVSGSLGSARCAPARPGGRRPGRRPPLQARPPSCRDRPGCREPDRARRRLDERTCRWPARPSPQRCAATRQSFPGRTPPPRPRLTDRRSPAAGQFAQIFPRRARRARPDFARSCLHTPSAAPSTGPRASIPRKANRPSSARCRPIRSESPATSTTRTTGFATQRRRCTARPTIQSRKQLHQPISLEHRRLSRVPCCSRSRRDARARDRSGCRPRKRSAMPGQPPQASTAPAPTSCQDP